VAAGKTLTVGPEAAVDFRSLTSIPTSAETASIQINGTIKLTFDGTHRGTLIAPNPGLFQTQTDLFKVAAFGTNGAIVLDYGTVYKFGSATPATGPALLELPFIGATSDGNAFAWAGSNDGAQIVIDGTGLTIRDANGSTNGWAKVTIEGPRSFILKEQTLTLDTNVELLMANGEALHLAGDATAGGAQIKGAGKIIAGKTEITGGSSGWRVFGSDSISIRQDTADTASIVNFGTGTTTSLRAMGQSAVITQLAGSGNGLTIESSAVVELGGTATTPAGSIVLKADIDPATDHGTLTFAASANSKLLLGPGTGGTALTGAFTTPTIGGKEITQTLPIGGFTALDGKLIVVGGVAAGGNIVPANSTIVGTTNNDVTIASNAVFVQ
jgi:hypothetical protein